MKKRQLPEARVGDVIVGDTHPIKGFVMFRVAWARQDKNGHWIYVSEDGVYEINEVWVEKIYRSKELKK